jgi:hypothetical protein
MERALFVTNAKRLDSLKKKNRPAGRRAAGIAGLVPKRFTRLYFGNEFCERLIPSARDLEKALSYAQKERLAFSLVTPYVTDAGIKRLGRLFSLLKKRKMRCEVIVNDWGVLHFVNDAYPECIPVLGRLLTKQKRGPKLITLLERKTRPRLCNMPHNPKARVFVIEKKLPYSLDPYYKGSNTTSVPAIHELLLNQRIRRVELDNTAQGLFLELPKDALSASLYVPYVYISTTFFCPTAGCEREKKPALKIKPCKKECQKYIFRLRHKTIPRDVFLRGNTQFYRNATLPAGDLEQAGINRIVYEPDIPV